MLLSLNNVMEREYVHVDYESGFFPIIVYYEPLDKTPNINALSGRIHFESKSVWFCLGLYPNEDEPWCYSLTLENDYDPISLAEYDPSENRFVISFSEVPGDHYIEVYYLPQTTNWKQEGF